MTNKCCLTVLAASLIGIVSCTMHYVPYDFKLRLFNDSVYHLVAQSISIPDMDRARADTITTGFSIRCTSQQDSLLRFRMVIEQLSRNKQHAMFFLPGKSKEEMEWDAFADSCQQGVIGDSLQVVCSRKGEVLSVQGVERIIKKISHTTGHDTRDVFSNLHDQFSTKNLEDLLKQSFFYLSGQPAKQGASWVNNYTLTAKAPVKYSNLITAQEVQGDSVILDIKTVLSARTGEGGRVFAEGNQWGTVTASRVTGMPYRIILKDSLVSKTDTYKTKAEHVFTVSAR
jgi:hypothetical protein